MARFKKKKKIDYQLFHGTAGNTWCIINGKMFVPVGDGCIIADETKTPARTFRFIAGSWYPDGKELVDFLK